MLYTNTILHDRLWILSNFFYSFFFSPARTEHWNEEIPQKNKRKFHKLTQEDKIFIKSIAIQHLIQPLKDIYAISTRSRI